MPPRTKAKRTSRYPVLPLATIANETANALECVLANVREQVRHGESIDPETLCKALRSNIRSLRTRKLYY